LCHTPLAALPVNALARAGHGRWIVEEDEVHDDQLQVNVSDNER
jgi:hypothetical protein